VILGDFFHGASMIADDSYDLVLYFLDLKVFFKK
jgi:hypothetical protein